MRLLVVGHWLAAFQGVNAGVCEELQIPMETVELPGIGFVCKVRECETPEYGEDGRPLCIPCYQGPVTLDQIAGSEFCPVALGTCVSGRCTPRTDTDYYEVNFGKKWEGLSTFKAISVTHYGGETASGGYPGHAGVDDMEPCFQKLGIDGVAAVPPHMYGSNSYNGQGMFKRNNLCYKLTGADGIVRVVAIMDRCGGYVQCSEGSTPIEDITIRFDFPEIDKAEGAKVWADANQCVTNEGSRIFSGLGQRCWYFTEGSDVHPKACCEGKCGVGQQQVDWCGSNSHPHFDVSVNLIDLLCDAGGGQGVAAGSCQLQYVEAVKCPVWPKPGKCCGASETCDSCTPKTGSCSNGDSDCSACGGLWCPGDSWHDICAADPTDIPPPYPGWTTRPPDPPVPPPDHTRTPSPPPGPDATNKPTFNPGGDTSGGGGSGDGGTGHGGDDGGGSSKAKIGAIVGATVGGVAVLALLGFGLRRLQDVTPSMDAEFEADQAETYDVEDREGIAQQMSEDFA